MAASSAAWGRRQLGFTLLELLLAVSIFALLAAGSAQLLSVMVKADAARQGSAESFRRLSRAMGLLQQDTLHAVFPSQMKTAGHAVMLQGQSLQWMVNSPQTPGPSYLGEMQVVRYWVEAGVLWRQRRTLAEGVGRAQRLLEGVTALQWRVFVPGQGWRTDWPASAGGNDRPLAIEVTLSTERTRQIRRVLHMASTHQ
ncbi:type II secretion system minor pseudopilin GspJ [Pseudomonas sp. PSKL.D1]|uniref:type II secretion system minor pseudopilin GspJ n=1 Tax=Pseudomonas sp. PSKL.D1 TaxID=3029060 RepID=UPI0023811D59|nr:type II secretion system minor pseudopilin GspJ [Pseudomonas sp. PSKL.D1]WDY58362.1 type II secretion system minor pseudopilin GspJ [Pseudomonas sp. PSKL.D1]